MNGLRMITRTRTGVSRAARRVNAALLVLCACGAVFPSGAVSSVPLALSARVGDLIDEVERERFGLVPQIAGFKCAHAMGACDGTVMLVICREALDDTILTLSTTEAAHLSRYIDHHERIIQRKDPCRYDIIGHLVRGDGALPHTSTPVIVWIDDRAIMGSIVCVTDTSLLLWTDGASFDGERLADCATVMPAHRIETVMIPPPAQRRGSRAGRGALIGGITGLTAGLIFAATAPKPRQSGYPLLDDLSEGMDAAARGMAPILGGLGGTLLGAIAGATIRYESPPEPTLTFALDRDQNSFREAAATLRLLAIFPRRMPWVVNEFLEANHAASP